MVHRQAWPRGGHRANLPCSHHGRPARHRLLDRPFAEGFLLMRTLVSLRACLLAIGRALREPRIYAPLALAVVLWSLAYQQKTAYTVDVGGPDDDAYVSGFNAKEHNQALDYRWSGSSSTIRFPGIGNEP